MTYLLLHKTQQDMLHGFMHIYILYRNTHKHTQQGDFLFFSGGRGLPCHYLLTMNFEKDSKLQRKTQVLQRRPERSSIRRVSIVTWHYQKSSCEEAEEQKNHFPFQSWMQSPRTLMRLLLLSAVDSGPRL